MTERCQVFHVRCAPAGAVYIGRTTGELRGLGFGNPFLIGRDGTREQVIQKYREYFEQRVASDPEFRSRIIGLQGKAIACWCTPLPCHGDVIAEWVNEHAAEVDPCGEEHQV